MSRSEPTEVRNPAKRFYQWSGDEGTINYYDKELKEKVNVPMPFTFLVLDRLTTIAGYSDEDASGFWSNEIRNLKTERLTVRTRNGIKKEGLYEDVKSIVGAKYAQSVYIAYYDDDKQLQIGNFKFTGCAVSAWIEFCKGRDIFTGAVTIKDRGEMQKKGKTEYFAPTFEAKLNVSEETNEAALALDRELQTYLRAYFALRGEERASAATASGHSMDYSGEDFPPTPADDDFAPPLVPSRGEDFDDDIPF